MTWLDNHERIFELIETRYEPHPPKVADMVAVIRCRDCKLWESNDCEWNPFYNDSDLDEPDGFCAWGESRHER